MNTVDTDQPPPVFYRYLSWNNQYQKRLLTENEVHFTAPVDFNDPFDCQAFFDSSATAGEIRLYLSRPGNMPEEVVALPRKERDRIISNRVVELRTDKGRQGLKNQALRDVNNGTGVLALTECKDSLPMWAHYADSHRGVCVGLETASLEETLCEVYRRRDRGSVLRRVEYVEDYPRLNPFKKGYNLGDYVETATRTKSLAWAYEREWRMIMGLVANDSRTYKLLDGVIKEVILGCRVPPNDQDEIKRLIRERYKGARLFRAKVSEDRFALDFVDATDEL